MDKKTAIDLLGGTPKKAAAAMGYTSIQAIHMWPNVLSQGVEDRVNGAVMRIKAGRKNRALRARTAAHAPPDPSDLF
jgi:hypothetical protein